MRARRMLGALNEPEFRRLYFARGFSQLGDGLVPVALAVLDMDLRRAGFSRQRPFWALPEARSQFSGPRPPA